MGFLVDRHKALKCLAKMSLLLGCFMLMVTLTALVKNLVEGEKYHGELVRTLAPIGAAFDHDKDVNNVVVNVVN